MKKRYENHELYQLIKDFKKYLKENPKAPPFFKVKVDSNPYGKGGERELWFGMNKYGCLSSVFPHQCDTDDINYAWNRSWTNGTYKGSVEVIGFAEFKKFEL